MASVAEAMCEEFEMKSPPESVSADSTLHTAQKPVSGRPAFKKIIAGTAHRNRSASLRAVSNLGMSSTARAGTPPPETTQLEDGEYGCGRYASKSAFFVANDKSRAEHRLLSGGRNGRNNYGTVYRPVNDTF